MSRRTPCWHNAAVERFFSTLTLALMQDRCFATHTEAIAAITEYIADIYNTRRWHSAPDYLSRLELESHYVGTRLAAPPRCPRSRSTFTPIPSEARP